MMNMIIINRTFFNYQIYYPTVWDRNKIKKVISEPSQYSNKIQFYNIPLNRIKWSV